MCWVNTERDLFKGAIFLLWADVWPAYLIIVILLSQDNLHISEHMSSYVNAEPGVSKIQNLFDTNGLQPV